MTVRTIAPALPFWLAVLLWAGAASAQDGVAGLFDSTKLLADFRYRYEHVGQNGFAHAASANTARLRLGLQNSAGDFQFLVEGEGTALGCGGIALDGRSRWRVGPRRGYH